MSRPAKDQVDLGPERRRELAKALAAYQHLMNEVVPESQYFQGRRENVERTAYLGDIVERAAARQRERERDAAS